MSNYRIKLADSDIEREQIHELNYETFVEEIPQHEPNVERRLVDRFDPENEYVIATTGDGSVVGMLALRASRPFSLDQKLADLEGFLPPHRSVCEVRLLAVRPGHRHRRLLRDLMAFAARRSIEAGRDLAVISGTTGQLDLYHHIGFEPFGPLVGTEGARYQPMYLTLERFVASIGNSLGVERPETQSTATASFLPGPITPSKQVRTAFAGAVLSHRSPKFVELVGRVRRKLCNLTRAADAVLLLGSGTLANDIVASCIAARGGRGLVLANGEFGERLVDHAQRAALEFDVRRHSWGAPFDEGQTLAILRRSKAEWLWAAHCETSTGILNDLGMLSGKGVGAYAGLAAVLSDSSPPRQPALVPRYLDLNLWRDRESVPFTHSSNLVYALDAALSQTSWQARLAVLAHDARWLRRSLRAHGLRVLAPEDVASPGVTTIELPGAAQSSDIGCALGQAGFEVAWRSAYLAERNWIQIALMGDYDCSALRELPDAVARAVRACILESDRAA
jgi:aspartate aminotransferase-like enzyme/GNAT superfamily N-acetyltransferase